MMSDIGWRIPAGQTRGTMDLNKQKKSEETSSAELIGTAGEAVSKHEGHHRRRTPLTYEICDALTGIVLCALLTAMPWLFAWEGRWPHVVANSLGYALGAIWLAKLCIRQLTGYIPMRWGSAGDETSAARQRRDRTMTRGLAALTFAILGWTLISAWNGGGTFTEGMKMLPREHIGWLPHSYDAPRTWEALGRYTAWALVFWAARDWFLGKTREERRGMIELWRMDGGGTPGPWHVPARIRRFLWVLCLGGAVVAVEALTQRWSGTHLILWHIKPALSGPDNFFGPFWYRGNAAQYFNLLWPLGAALAWTMYHQAREAARSGARTAGLGWLWMIPIVVLMFACPMAAASRLGAALACCAMLALVVKAGWQEGASRKSRLICLVILCAAALQAALILGWKTIEPRYEQLAQSGLKGWHVMNDTTFKVSQNAPWLGIGPDVYPAFARMLWTRNENEFQPHAQNDWLETLAAFGRLGILPVLAWVLLIPLKWRGGAGAVLPSILSTLLWTVLGLCLFHALFHFPFQNPPVALLWIVLAALASASSHGRA